MLDSSKRAMTMASHLYRDKWLAAGVPPLKTFFDNLTAEERFMCFHVVHEVTKPIPKTYRVEGGIFTDTTFTEVIPDSAESYGPFETYEDAKRAWITGMFNSKLDICTHRLRIVTQ